MYLARRYFQLSPAEWDDLGWDLQQTYLDGLEGEEVVSFGRGGGGEGAIPSHAAGGPQTRTADPGTKVIDITALRAELDAKRGGE